MTGRLGVVAPSPDWTDVKLICTERQKANRLSQAFRNPLNLDRVKSIIRQKAPTYESGPSPCRSKNSIHGVRRDGDNHVPLSC